MNEKHETLYVMILVTVKIVHITHGYVELFVNIQFYIIYVRLPDCVRSVAGGRLFSNCSLGPWKRNVWYWECAQVLLPNSNVIWNVIKAVFLVHTVRHMETESGCSCRDRAFYPAKWYIHEMRAISVAARYQMGIYIQWKQIMIEFVSTEFWWVFMLFIVFMFMFLLY